MPDLRRELTEGRAALIRSGTVVLSDREFPPYVVVDDGGVEVEAVTGYLRDMALSDMRPLSCRSYAHDLLRWLRILWMLQMDWDHATGSEVDVMVGWLKTAPNPQRRRSSHSSTVPGAVNAKTGKPMLAEGYSPRTINHALTAVHGFYVFHAHFGRGPVVNPVPSSRARRTALTHRSPIEAVPQFKRARLRQRVADRAPRAIPDFLWDELFEAMGCDISSGINVKANPRNTFNDMLILATTLIYDLELRTNDKLLLRMALKSGMKRTDRSDGFVTLSPADFAINRRTPEESKGYINAPWRATRVGTWYS